MEPERLAAQVIEHKADIGIALDGDGDRAVFADEKGHVVLGDATLAILATKLHNEGRLSKNTVIATEQSSIGLERSLENNDIRVIRCKVGDRYVAEAMKNNQCNFGGEQSGHIIIGDHTTTGDGMVAALQVLEGMVKQQRQLSELAQVFEVFPQAFRNVRVKE